MMGLESSRAGNAWRCAIFAASLAIAGVGSALAEETCDLNQLLDWDTDTSKNTGIVRRCAIQDKKIDIGYHDDNINWRWLASNPKLILKLSISSITNSLKWNDLSSRTMSRLYSDYACRELDDVLSKAMRRCPLKGFYDISVADMMNSFVLADPKVMNSEFIAAPITFWGRVEYDVRLGEFARDDLLVFNSLRFDRASVKRINIDNILVIGDLIITNSHFETFFWDDGIILGDVIIENSRFNYIDVENIYGSGMFRMSNVEIDDGYMLDMAFSSVSMSGVTSEWMSEYQREDFQRFESTGVMRP